jgi:poly-D-alanine transfer protein DltD
MNFWEFCDKNPYLVAFIVVVLVMLIPTSIRVTRYKGKRNKP